MSDSCKVVQSAPPKKLSEWFISSDNSKLEQVNVWCFDQETAYERSEERRVGKECA